MKPTKEEIAQAKEQLVKLLPKGARVYTVLRSVAKSGMSRRIDFYTIVTPSDGDAPYMQ